MLLRSLKLVHFIGVPDLQVRDLHDGAQAVALPAGVPARVVQDAVRFALLGRVPDISGQVVNVISEGQGYTWVEAAFRSAEGATASVFRGMDRRGAPHVSVREDGSMRITSEPREVVARLENLLGATADVIDAATFLSCAEDPASSCIALGVESASGGTGVGAAAHPAPVASSGATLTAGAGAIDPEAVDAARRGASDSVETLRRSLRGRLLRDQAARDHDELLALGARLRRDRTDVAVTVDKIVADRERVRLRLRRVNEYRDLAAAARTSASVDAASRPDATGVAAPERTVRRTDSQTRTQPSRLVEWGLGLCALGLLALLMIPATAGYVRNDEFGRAATGLGLIVASGSYLYVASRRHHQGRFVTSVDVSGDPSVDGVRQSAQPRRPAVDHTERESLRARFADIGDPDAPGLVDDLRARLAAFDQQASPLQRRLERLDDALSLLDVEAGRAARSLHRPMPPKDEAPSGFGPDADIDALETRIANLGDSVHQASVERDALVAQGGVAPVEAARAAEESFARFGAACGDESAPLAALTRVRVNAADIDSLPADVDADAIASGLRDEIDAIAQAALARAAAVAAAAASRASNPLDLPPPQSPAGSSANGLEATLAPIVASLTGGRFDTVRVVERKLELSGAAGTMRWADLDAPTRVRVALATRLRAGEAALAADGSDGGSPRAVVLDAWPESFSSDAELAAFAAEHAPRVTQVIYGRSSAASDVTAPATSRASSSRGGDSARRGERRRA